MKGHLAQNGHGWMHIVRGENSSIYRKNFTLSVNPIVYGSSGNRKTRLGEKVITPNVAKQETIALHRDVDRQILQFLQEHDGAHSANTIADKEGLLRPLIKARLQELVASGEVVRERVEGVDLFRVER